MCIRNVYISFGFLARSIMSSVGQQLVTGSAALLMVIPPPGYFVSEDTSATTEGGLKKTFASKDFFGGYIKA